jgi:hypothetical protein
MKTKLMKYWIFILLCFVGVVSDLSAQGPNIVYSAPEKEDTRRTNFDIIGKIGGNFLVYKRNRTVHEICVYDNEMNLKARETRTELEGDRVINIDFIAYPDFAYAIYQYQRRNVVYCNAVKINSLGKADGPVIVLDTTEINFSTSNKIYTTISSDDKQRVMVLKINNRNQERFVFTTLLYDNQLILQRRDRMVLGMQVRNDFFTDFHLSNEGELIFAKYRKSSMNAEYIVEVDMIIKYPDSSAFTVRDIGMGSRILDEIRLKVDNTNKRVLLSALYFLQKRGNIEGLYLMKWDKKNNQKLKDTAFQFTEELRAQARGEDAGRKAAFNNYYIKNVVIRKDGGFVIVGESLYTSSRSGNFNRWDNMGWGNPWMNSMDYYSMFPNQWGMPWNRFGSPGITRYHADNIMILAFSKEAALEWSNVIPKSQYDDEGDNLISYATFNTGGEVHFLFNQYERRTLMLNDQSIGAEGKLNRNPTLKNLDKGYEFMPRFAKQVAARQMIVPCWFRNYLCFAKIEY